MKGLFKTVIGIAIGIILIPALYTFALAAFSTVLAFMVNPRVMLIAVAILAVISLPGGIIVWLVKK